MTTAVRKPDDELPRGLTVTEFLAWYEQQDGRYELHNGDVIAMSPARVGHARLMGLAYLALVTAIRSSGLPCHALPVGAAVHVSDTTWYEPDLLVYCGPQAPDDDLEIGNPVIIVEVASPSTVRLDKTVKLMGYFDVASVHHYLIIHRELKRLVHHQRQPDGTILTRIVANGALDLMPPGLKIEVADLLT